MATEYDRKIAELQVYLPALERRIIDARNRTDDKVRIRLEKLRDIVDTKIKVPMDILLKMEEAIRKFIKDVSNTNSNHTASLNTVQSTEENGSTDSKEVTRPQGFDLNQIVVKKEVDLNEPPTAITNDDDDDDDVEFVQSSTPSDSIIILDDDSSDEEPTKHSSSVEAVTTQPTQVTIKKEVIESASPISKEIVQSKEMSEQSENNLSKNNPVLPDSSVRLVASKDVERRSNLVENSESSFDKEQEVSQPDLNSHKSPNVSRTIDSVQDVIPQVQFDPSKVAESRGILQEIESQLKELTTSVQLTLSLDDIGKNDSIDEFLSKSGNASTSEPLKILKIDKPASKTDESVQVCGGKDDTIRRKSTNTVDPPFLFPSFGKFNISCSTAAESVDGVSENPAILNNADEKRREANLESSSANDHTELETVGPQKINEQLSISDVVTSVSLNPESIAEMVSTPDADLSAPTTNRLADIIASLRRNLSHIDATAPNSSAISNHGKTETTENVVTSQPPELFVNKIQLTEIPSLVQDMLNTDPTSDDEPDGLIIEDSSFSTGIMGDNLLGDLDNSSNGGSIEKVLDMPNHVLEEDDSLDREINQALTGTRENGTATNTDVDSSELPKVIDDDGINRSYDCTLDASSSKKDDGKGNADTDGANLTDKHVESTTESQKCAVRINDINDSSWDGPLLLVDLDSSVKTMPSKNVQENIQITVILDDNEDSLEDKMTNAFDSDHPDSKLAIMGNDTMSNTAKENVPDQVDEENTTVEVPSISTSSSQIETNNQIVETNDERAIETVNENKIVNPFQMVNDEIMDISEESQGTVIFEITTSGYENVDEISESTNFLDANVAVKSEVNEAFNDNEVANDNSKSSTVDESSTDFGTPVRDERKEPTSPQTFEKVNEEVQRVAFNVKSCNSKLFDTNVTVHRQLDLINSATAEETERIENPKEVSDVQNSTEKCTNVSQEVEKNLVTDQTDTDPYSEANEATESEELFLAKLRSAVRIRPITPIHEQDHGMQKVARKNRNAATVSSTKVIASFGIPKKTSKPVDVQEKLHQEESSSDRLGKSDVGLNETQLSTGSTMTSDGPLDDDNPIKENVLHEHSSSVVSTESKNTTVLDASSAETTNVPTKLNIPTVIDTSAQSIASIVPETSSDMPIEPEILTKSIERKTSLSTEETQKVDLSSTKGKTVADNKSNSEFQDLIKEKLDLEMTINALKRQLSQQSQIIAETLKTTPSVSEVRPEQLNGNNLSEISESDEDCVSLSLSDISGPELGEIVERPRTSYRQAAALRFDRELSSKVSRRMQFAADPTALETEPPPIQITIKNERTCEEDLRAKILAKAKIESCSPDQSHHELRHKKRKRKKAKRKKRRLELEAADPATHHSPIRYVDCQGNTKYCREDSSSDSNPDDELIKLRYQREILSQQLLKQSYLQSRLGVANIKQEYDMKLESYRRNGERLIKREFIDDDDDKYEMRRVLKRDYSPLRATDRRSPRTESQSPPILRVFKRRAASRSPLRKLSDSPERSSRSPRKLHRSPKRRSASPYRRARSPRRLSRSPLRPSRSKRRPSRSPRRLSRSPARLTRSERRSSRSPRRLTRSPRRPSRSPRRIVRSPRRSSRSPRRRRTSISPSRTSKSSTRLSRSTRRLSRSPKRRSTSPKRDYRDRSPNRSSKSPKKSTMLPKSPKKDLKSTWESTQQANENVDETPSVVQSSSDKTAVTKAAVAAVIALTDSEDETAVNDNEKQNENENESIEFTIEVSDDEELVEAPPPPIISSQIKLSPKQEVTETTSKQIHQTEEGGDEEEHVILIDDDDEVVAAARTSLNQQHTSETTSTHPKLESMSKTESTVDESSMEATRSEEEDNLYAPEDDTLIETVNTLQEKNLMELQAIKVKLERETGLSEDFLTQLIGSAVDKFNAGPSSAELNDTMVEQQARNSTMVKLPCQFYEPVDHTVPPRVSRNDPRLNRMRPTTASEHDDMVKSCHDEIPPPPMIPRLTPAVALPSGSQPSKHLGYNNKGYSDDECLSVESGSVSDGSFKSDDSKKQKKYVMVEVSKLEEIIGQQIEKFLTANKQSEENQKKKSPSASKKTKKDKPIPTTSRHDAADPTTKKPRKNTVSKDGSGASHTTAEKFVFDVRKKVAATLSKSKNASSPEKVQRPKSRTRIQSRIMSSSDSEIETTTTNSKGKKSPQPKILSADSSLRDRITNDVAGIIKLGKTSKSSKGKPTPALKMAEQINDVNLLTPLREIPYDDNRKKKPETGQSKKLKRVPKNIDPAMHCNSGEADCLLCKEKGKDEELISHYVNVHRENEVYTARLESDQVEVLTENPNRVKPLRNSNIEKFTGKCPFCNEAMTCPIGRFMEHFASHTGEYAYECNGCGTRDSRKRDLLRHCNTECEKDATFVYVYRYDLSNKIILGHVCSKCNYTQLNRANVIKHIRTEHEQQQANSADFITVTLFEVHEGAASTDSGVEDEAVDNIEVNNEAIAEDDDNYYDGYDYFDSAPPSPRPVAKQASVDDEDQFEYVKNEMLSNVFDAIENIDWEPLEETFADNEKSSFKKIAASTLQQPTMSLNESIHIVPKDESLDQSYLNASNDIGSQIFTEIHAMAAQTPLKISALHTETAATNDNRNDVKDLISSIPAANTPSEDKKPPVPAAELQPCPDEILRAVLEDEAPLAPVESKELVASKKLVKFKSHDNLPKNMARVQSIGIEKLSPTRTKLHCFVLDCAFSPTESLDELRRHMKSHRHKWSGKCISCAKPRVKKFLSFEKELSHLVKEHLPKKSLVPKMLRPWIVSDTTDSYKTKDVCEMLITEYHLENLYKCMGPDCVFTTNSSSDMQYHVTLHPTDEISALNCCYCEEKFIHSKGLVDHIGRIHGASNYQCSKCFYRSIAAYNVQMHQRSFHPNEKMLRILQCTGQIHNFSTEILEILDNRQKNVKPLSCPSCRKMVFVKHLLIDHIVKDHSMKDPGEINSALYDCIYCNFGTTDLLTIRQHMANLHPSQMLYVCGLVFIKACHPSAQQTVDISSIKTTSLVYIGDPVNDNVFITKDRLASKFEKNSIEEVNSGKDSSALNERIRQMFGECVVNCSEVETYMRKIAEGMIPDTIKTEERSELDYLVSVTIGSTGCVGTDLYTCGFAQCTEACGNFNQFDRHISTHADNKKQPIYRCPHCKCVVASNQIRMHTIQHRRHRYLCFFCGDSSSSQNTAIEHLKLAHQSNSIVFKYLTSDKDWGSQGLNEQESRIFVAMPRNNKDDEVEQMLQILGKRHGERNVSDNLEPAEPERPQSPIERKEETVVPVFVAPNARLRCNTDECPFVAKTDDDLLQHIAERHRIMLSGRYSCAHCSYSFASAQLKISRIGNHLQYHGPTIVVCNVCNYYHYHRHRVLNHISTCHPYNFVTLTVHIRTPQATKTNIEILYNKSVRSPEDSFKCTLCEAVLTECEDIFVHMKELHQLSVLFKCDACVFCDSTLEVVETHAEQVHAGDDKRRIRCKFVPLGSKWKQNLTPFALLLEYSQSDPVNCLENMVKNVPLPGNGSKSPAQDSKPCLINADDAIKSESRKRKLDEAGSSKSTAESKKSRTSGVKRPSSSKSLQESSKRQKNNSPPRTAEGENVDPSLRKAKSQKSTSESSGVKMARADPTVAVKLELDAPRKQPDAASTAQIDSAASTSAAGAVQNSDDNPPKAVEKTLPRLKLVPFEKLMKPLPVASNSNANNSPLPTQPTKMFSAPIQSPSVPEVAFPTTMKRKKDDIFFICFQCGFKQDCFQAFSEHCKAYSCNPVNFRVAKKLLCAFCNTVLTFPELKAHHFNQHPNDLFVSREFANHRKCAECTYEYTHVINELKKHGEEAHPSLHLQLHSSYKYLNQEYLDELLKIGDGRVADVFRCPGCDHTYLQEPLCKNHIARAHPSLGPDVVPNRVPFKRLLYGCNQCKVFFEAETRAILHIRKHIDPYGCIYCENSFPTHKALEDHYCLGHKCNEQSYKFKNVSENFKRFMEMLLRFANGLVLSKYEVEYTDYGQNDLYLQRIENMEKIELHKWISKQQRTEEIDSIARIKIELEHESNMFCRSYMQ